MRKQDLNSLQEGYQQIEEGLLGRMGTRLNAAVNAFTGYRGNPTLETVSKHAEELCEDLVKLNIIEKRDESYLRQEIKNIILDCVKRLQSR
jgi:hypothetical protein